LWIITEADRSATDHLSDCLNRHASGDWGVVYAEDAASNEEALKNASTERNLSDRCCHPH